MMGNKNQRYNVTSSLWRQPGIPLWITKKVAINTENSKTGSIDLQPRREAIDDEKH